MRNSFQFLMNPQLQDIRPLFAGACRDEPAHLDTFQPADCMFLYYIWSGSGTLYCKDRTYPIGAGQAFLLLPGHGASLLADDNEPPEYQWIGFSGTMSHRFSELPTVFDVPDGVFSKLENPSAMNTHAEYLLASELLKLFYLLLEPKREKGNYIQQLVDRIQSSYMQKLSVEELAKEFRMDRSYLNRRFKQSTGHSIKEYLTHVRLDRAVWYLARGYSVKETAELCGFNDVSNFSRAFKRHHTGNLSPQQWQMHISRVHKENALLTRSGKGAFSKK